MNRSLYSRAIFFSIFSLIPMGQSLFAADPKSPDIEKLLKSRFPADRIKGLKLAEDLGTAGVGPYVELVCTAMLDASPEVAKAANMTMKMTQPELHQYLDPLTKNSGVGAVAPNGGVVKPGIGEAYDINARKVSIIQTLVGNEKAKPTLPFLVALAKTEMIKAVTLDPQGTHTVARALVRGITELGPEDERVLDFFLKLTSSPNAPAWAAENGIHYLISWAETDTERRKKVAPNLALNLTNPALTLLCLRSLSSYGELAGPYTDKIKRIQKGSTDSKVTIAASEALIEIEAAVAKAKAKK